MTDTGDLYLEDTPDHLVAKDGYLAMWMVDAAGQRWPLLADVRTLLDTSSLRHPAAVVRHLAPHEGTGALPHAYRERLGLLCGAPCRTSPRGRPCRNYVRHPGERCPHHQEAPSG